ncbi:3-isopropylmalate dehydrogenase [Candidatus Woesearchaeota archaeon]|nr:3-isopropylmalate dehydrogenase [Candidatus Woesearchaeota archaeon]
MTENYHNVAMIKGDLNGVTVSDAVLEVDSAVSPKLVKPIKFTQKPYNADYFLENDITELGQKELDELKQYDQIFLGAIGDDTKIKRGTLELGILLKIRQEFDQYVGLRPVVLPEGVESPIKGKDHRHINFEICRENSEGLYVAVGRVDNEGTDEEVGIQEMHCSYKGVKRLAEFAAERAIARQKGDKPTLHFVFKTNVLTYAAVPWQRVFKEFQEREDIEARYMHIDNFMMQMVSKPEQFDVVITENMFGDLSTDLGAVIQGGIGTAVSGNINPTGEYPSMFEPIHGTAPDLWFELDENEVPIPGTFVEEKVQLIRPEAALLSYAMMLEQMGELKAAEVVKAAALANVKDSDYKTKKLDDLIEQACVSVKEAA